MSNINTTMWSLEPHTLAKHEILKRYLKAWFPIMSKHNPRLVYIDAFAGPGKYENGEDGSPLIAIYVAKEHCLQLAKELIFMFIEKDINRLQHLENTIDNSELPSNFKINLYQNNADKIISDILDDLEKQNFNLAPTFLFIDPFGYSEIPLETVARFMRNKKCEVLINFMYSSIKRWIHVKDSRTKYFDCLFGTDKWREVRAIAKPKEKEIFLINLYKQQLEHRCNIEFVRYFKMINKANQTQYALFYGTNHIKGLEVMKDAMWIIDPTCGFSFSDRTDPRQELLFELEPNYDILKKEILDEFQIKKVRVEDIQKHSL